MTSAIDSGRINTSLATPLASAPPVHVLFVDDDQAVGTTCVELLTRAGFAANGAESVEQAWAALAFADYHLVITDYQMPKASGLELARQMRAAGMMQPVILISGMPGIEKLATDASCRIVGILPKPFSFPELLIQVNAALDSAQISAQAD